MNNVLTKYIKYFQYLVLFPQSELELLLDRHTYFLKPCTEKKFDLNLKLISLNYSLRCVLFKKNITDV